LEPTCGGLTSWSLVEWLSGKAVELLPGMSQGAWIPAGWGSSCLTWAGAWQGLRGRGLRGGFPDGKPGSPTCCCGLAGPEEQGSWQGVYPAVPRRAEVWWGSRGGVPEGQGTHWGLDLHSLMWSWCLARPKGQGVPSGCGSVQSYAQLGPGRAGGAGSPAE
jgi:hypothetical protein